MVFTILALLVGTVVFATLLPLSRKEVWWIRDLDFPRLQIAIGALAVLAAMLLMLDPTEPEVLALIVIDAACLAYQGWWIIPYTAIFPNEVKAASLVSGGAGGGHTGSQVNERSASGADGADGAEGTEGKWGEGDRIRILTANVLAPNRNASALIDLIRRHRPDVFVTLESDKWWQTRLDTLEDDYPHAIKCPLDNLYGMHVYSRLPLEDAETAFLIERGIPSMHAKVLLPSGRRVLLHFLHPAPPSPTENDESTERDAELLIVAKNVARTEMPVIVAGDLNDVAWSETTRLFRKISGLLDPRIGRGMFNTFHADYWFMRWPLDHLFHSRHFTLSFIKRLPAFGSDHFPMLVELVYDERNGKRQEGLQADGQDQQLAEEKIETEAAKAGALHD